MKLKVVTALALCGSLMACSSDPNGRVDAINKEIREVEGQLHEYRVKELNTEVHAQQLMQEDWKQFANDQKKAEEFNNKIEHLKKRLDDLKNEREALLK